MKCYVCKKPSKTTICQDCISHAADAYTYIEGAGILPPMYTLEPTATEYMIAFPAEFKMANFVPMAELHAPDRVLEAIGRAFDDAIDLAAI